MHFFHLHHNGFTCPSQMKMIRPWPDHLCANISEIRLDLGPRSGAHGRLAQFGEAGKEDDNEESGKRLSFGGTGNQIYQQNCEHLSFESNLDSYHRLVSFSGHLDGKTLRWREEKKATMRPKSNSNNSSNRTTTKQRNKMKKENAPNTPYLYRIYTVSIPYLFFLLVPYLCRIYAVSTPYLCRIYAVSMP